MAAQEKSKQNLSLLKKSMLPLLNLCQSLLNKISINKLTFIGFTLVVMPLVATLLFSANNVSRLAQQNTNAIFNVAQLTQLHSKLDDTSAKIERYASQYIVLKDNELFIAFNYQHQELLRIIHETESKQQDKELKKLLVALRIESERLQTLILSEGANNFTLEQIQVEFRELQNICEQLKDRSNNVVNQQVFNLHQTTEDISSNILEHLFIIPITLLIAGIFIVLITQPLKRLTDKIETLEQGNFEQQITLNGPAEVIEIVDSLENMRQRLHSLELQKSSFIRHISHELKTPLAAIREGTELIYDNSVGELNDEQQEICDIIRSSVNRLQRLIEDLLDFNIVLDSTSLQTLEKTNLHELIQEACNVRKLDIKAKNLHIESNIHPDFILTNPQQFSVILDNILSNAIKFSPLNGTINIQCKGDKSQLTLNIIDQGPGISTELSEKVFDAFYQGKPPENSLIKGSGLGLTIVKELLLRLNGNIIITPAKKLSEEETTGTCVTISLPNKQTEDE